MCVCVLSVKRSFCLPRSILYKCFFKLPVPPENLTDFSGRAHGSCLAVKITALTIQAEMQRRNQETRSV